MFTALVTFCGMGMFCFTEPLPISYVSLEQCKIQGAITGGRLKADMNLPPNYPTSTTVECTDQVGNKYTLLLGAVGNGPV